jgi:hypothetical protein
VSGLKTKERSGAIVGDAVCQIWSWMRNRRPTEMAGEQAAGGCSRLAGDEPPRKNGRASSASAGATAPRKGPSSLIVT